jgi:hypothetical protein
MYFLIEELHTLFMHIILTLSVSKIWWSLLIPSVAITLENSEKRKYMVRAFPEVWYSLLAKLLDLVS